MDNMMLDREQGADARANTQVQIRVHATWDKTLNKVVFGMAGEVVPPTNGEVKGTTLKIKSNTGPADIRFKLKDKTHLDLEFDCADPIWIAELTSCDDHGCPPGSGMCGFTVSEKSESKLTLLNPNVPGEYAYMLRFIDENGDPHEYDPIIKNRA